MDRAFKFGIAFIASIIIYVLALLHMSKLGLKMLEKFWSGFLAENESVQILYRSLQEEASSVKNLSFWHMNTLYFKPWSRHNSRT